MIVVADPDFLTEFRLFQQEVRSGFTDLKKQIGETNDKGDGGTGLAGELARTKTRLYDLVKIKDTGTGWLKATAATLAVTGTLLLLGAKAFLVDLLAKAAG